LFRDTSIAEIPNVLGVFKFSDLACRALAFLTRADSPDVASDFRVLFLLSKALNLCFLFNRTQSEGRYSCSYSYSNFTVRIEYEHEYRCAEQEYDVIKSFVVGSFAKRHVCVAICLQIDDNGQRGDSGIDEHRHFFWFRFFAYQRLAADEKFDTLFV
jgi:hypothetical protein